MSLSFGTNDIRLLHSHNKIVRLNISLYDNAYTNLGSITGSIKACSFSLSGESDMRRTCSLTLVLLDGLNQDFNATWINNMVELKCELWDDANNTYVQYNLGRMLMTDGETFYSSTAKEIKLTLVDLMSNIADGRGNQLGYEILLNAGSLTIRDAFAAVVSAYSKYRLCNIENTDYLNEPLPYDISSKFGDYPFNLLKTLLSLVPHCEMYFDVNGVFTVKEISTKVDDPCDIGASVIDPILISERKGVNYTKVKNTVEIWGRSLDAKYMAESCKQLNGVYTVKIDDTFETLVVGETYCVVPDKASVDGQKMKIQSTEEYGIYTESGSGQRTPIKADEMQENVPYVIAYKDKAFILQGELVVHVIVQEIDDDPTIEFQFAFKEKNACNDVRWVVNSDSPFACHETLFSTNIGDLSVWRVEKEARIVLQGREYANIYTTQLAFERAEYELWQRTRLQDNITLEMLYVPWMEINDKIEYTSPESGEKIQLLVQTIEPDFKKWTMTVKGAKFYPVYPW